MNGGGLIERVVGCLTRTLRILIGLAGGEPPWIVRQVLWVCVAMVALSIAAVCALVPLMVWLFIYSGVAFR